MLLHINMVYKRAINVKAVSEIDGYSLFLYKFHNNSVLKIPVALMLE